MAPVASVVASPGEILGCEAYVTVDREQRKTLWKALEFEYGEDGIGAVIDGHVAPIAAIGGLWLLADLEGFGTSARAPLRRRRTPPARREEYPITCPAPLVEATFAAIRYEREKEIANETDPRERAKYEREWAAIRAAFEAVREAPQNRAGMSEGME